MFNTSLYNTGVSNNNELNDAIDNLTKFNYNAFYRAFVVDNNDASKTGKVKIRIPSLHGLNSDNTGYVQSSALPWATPAILSTFGHDSGSFLIPNIGDMVFVTFETENLNSPIYFGGIPLKKGREEKHISSTNINNNQSYVYDEDDNIKDIERGTERVIYKSLKGATIIIDDYDGNEYIKLIDQAGQEIMLENYDDSLNRRGKDLGISDKPKITITNNIGDKITLRNGKTYIKSKSLVIEADEVDMPGIKRNFSKESDLMNDILGESLSYDESKKSSIDNYHELIDEIIGNQTFLQSNRSIINTAIRMSRDINNEDVSTSEQTNYTESMITKSTEITEDIK